MNIPKQSPLKQIRKQCIECCGGSKKSVRFCHSTECPLWNLRFGKFPKTVIRENGNNNIQLFEKKNFKSGGKFSPQNKESTYAI
jgi:hypothetical protein